MKKVYTYLYLLPFALLTGCGQKKAAEAMVINPEKADDVMFEDVAGNIRIVPLSGDEPLYGFDYIRCYGDDVFAVDLGHEYVYYFKDGKHESTLGSIGRGPGEYITINQILYDSERKILNLINLTSRECIMQYSVPDMKYIGKIDMPSRIEAVRFYDDNTLLVALEQDSEKGLYLFDLNTKEVKRKVCNLSQYQFTNSTLTTEGIDKDCHIITLMGPDNALCQVTDNGLDTLFRFNYGKEGAAQVFYGPLNSMEDADKYLEYLFSNEDKFRGCYNYHADKNGVSFWYSTLLKAKDHFHFYRLSKGVETHLQGFNIPGLKGTLSPSCKTETGYASIVSGIVETIADSTTAPSPLAQKIIDAVAAQPDDYPVLVYYDL